jgi:hypothetical protein
MQVQSDEATPKVIKLEIEIVVKSSLINATNLICQQTVKAKSTGHD